MFTSVHRAYKSVSHSPAMKERRNLPLDEIMKALKRIKIGEVYGGKMSCRSQVISLEVLTHVIEQLCSLSAGEPVTHEWPLKSSH